MASSPKYASVVESKSAVGGGVQDLYGEDSATEEQFITPWTLSVARLSAFSVATLGIS